MRSSKRWSSATPSPSDVSTQLTFLLSECESAYRTLATEARKVDSVLKQLSENAVLALRELRLSIKSDSALASSVSSSIRGFVSDPFKSQSSNGLSSYHDWHAASNDAVLIRPLLVAFSLSTKSALSSSNSSGSGHSDGIGSADRSIGSQISKGISGSKVHSTFHLSLLALTALNRVIEIDTLLSAHSMIQVLCAIKGLLSRTYNASASASSLFNFSYDSTTATTISALGIDALATGVGFGKGGTGAAGSGSATGIGSGGSGGGMGLHSSVRISDEIQIKIVQILMQIPDSNSWELSADCVKICVYLCLFLSNSTNDSVKQTSLAAMQRIITVAMDGVNKLMVSYSSVIRSKDDTLDEPDITLHSTADGFHRINEQTSEACELFDCLFHDLCCLANPNGRYFVRKRESKSSDLRNVLESALSFESDFKSKPTIDARKSEETMKLDNKPHMKASSKSSPAGLFHGMTTAFVSALTGSVPSTSHSMDNHPEFVTDTAEAATMSSVIPTDEFVSPSVSGDDGGEYLSDTALTSVDHPDELDDFSRSFSDLRQLLLLDIDFDVDHVPMVELIEFMVVSDDFSQMVDLCVEVEDASSLPVTHIDDTVKTDESDDQSSQRPVHCFILHIFRLRLCPLIWIVLKRCELSFSTAPVISGLPFSHKYDSMTDHSVDTPARGSTAPSSVASSSVTSPTVSGLTSVATVPIELSSSGDAIRFARLCGLIIEKYYELLPVETEHLLAECVQLLDNTAGLSSLTSDGREYPEWTPLITLEILRNLLNKSALIKYFYCAYDLDPDTHEERSKLFSSLIHALGRFLRNSTVRFKQQTKGWSPKRLPNNKYFTYVKNLSKPPKNISLFVSIAVLCLASFVEGLAALSSEASKPQPESVDTPIHSRRSRRSMSLHSIGSPKRSPSIAMFNERIVSDIARDMTEVAWRPLLGALSHMLAHSGYEQQYQQVLGIYQTTIRICAELKSEVPMCSLLRSMSQHALPAELERLSSITELMIEESEPQLPKLNPALSSNSTGGDVTGSDSASVIPGGVSSAVAPETALLLSIKNICAVHSLVNIAHGLGCILSADAWNVLLSNFEKLDYVFGHRWRLVDAKQQPIPVNSHWKDEVQMLKARLSQLFEGSKHLDIPALKNLVVALTGLSSNSLAVIGTLLSSQSEEVSSVSDAPAASSPAESRRSGVSTPGARSQSSLISPSIVPSFGLLKFIDTVRANICRLHEFWEQVETHIILICNSPHRSTRDFGLEKMVEIQLDALHGIYGAAYDGSLDHLHHYERDKSAGKLSYKQRRKLLAFQDELLNPYIKLFSSRHSDMKEGVISAVSAVVEQCGEMITVGWPTVVSLLLHVPGSHLSLLATKKAFNDTRLLTSDFLPILPGYCMIGLIDTVGHFGSMKIDPTNGINLSAITLLWRVSDYITVLLKTSSISEEEKSELISDQMLVMDDDEEEKFVEKETKQRTIELLTLGDAIQLKILTVLKTLCIDTRHPIRNSALQTLHSAVIAYGSLFKMDSWKDCIQILKVLVQEILVNQSCMTVTLIEAQKVLASPTRVVSDSTKECRAEMKNWLQTEQNCIQGAARVFTTFIADLHQYSAFQSYWDLFLESVQKLIERENDTVSGFAIEMCESILQSPHFISVSTKNIYYWNRMIECYEAMIDILARKEVQKRRLVNVFDTLISSITNLFDASKKSRRLFTEKQITAILDALDRLVSDCQFEPLAEPLEKLDTRLVRLRNLLCVFEQLPPLAPGITLSVIKKITDYLSFVQRCCVGYKNHMAVARAAELSSSADTLAVAPKTVPHSAHSARGTSRGGVTIPSTVRAIGRSRISQSEVILRRVHRGLETVSKGAVDVLLSFYSINLSKQLKSDCFQEVMDGLSQIISPSVCPFSVVSSAVRGFETVCKVGLPDLRMQADREDGSPEISYLGSWDILESIISIALNLESDGKDTEKESLDASEEEMTELKLNILDVLMKLILPYAHSAPKQLKINLIALLNANCASDVRSADPSISKQTKVAVRCVHSMFEICSDTLRERQKFDMYLSSLAYALLIPRLVSILERYMFDEYQHSDLQPHRHSEVVNILKHCASLRIHPDLDESACLLAAEMGEASILTLLQSSDDESRLTRQPSMFKLRNSGLSGNRAHLMRVYPVLCKLIHCNDHSVKQVLSQLFEVIGQEMGVS